MAEINFMTSRSVKQGHVNSVKRTRLVLDVLEKSENNTFADAERLQRSVGLSRLIASCRTALEEYDLYLGMASDHDLQL